MMALPRWSISRAAERAAHSRTAAPAGVALKASRGLDAHRQVWRRGDGFVAQVRRVVKGQLEPPLAERQRMRAILACITQLGVSAA